MSTWWRRGDSPRNLPAGEFADSHTVRSEEEGVRAKDLERQVRRLLRSLDVRPPLSVPDLCEALSRQRGRPIELRAFSMRSDGPLGAWLETATADVIVFQKETTSHHRDHIVLHELGHILADHPGPAGTDVWELLLPGLGAESIRRALHRCSYGNRQEQEAELVATIVGEWASILDHTAAGSSAEDRKSVV